MWKEIVRISVLICFLNITPNSGALASKILPRTTDISKRHSRHGKEHKRWKSPGNAADSYTEEIIFDYYSKGGRQHLTRNKSPLTADYYTKTVRFFLYTEVNPLNPFELVVGDSAQFNVSGFIQSGPVKLLIHGWKGSYQEDYIQNMKNAYLGNHSTKYINVVLVDWSSLTPSDGAYWKAALNVGGVAEAVSAFIKFLLRTTKITIKDFHIVGHSLGAHVAGITGQYIQSSLGLRIPRITGLDPANPGFSLLPISWRIDRTDADFVDIIHTAGDTYGIHYTLGHVDFYPNGGRFQNGCTPWDFSCNHGRSPDYFIESLLNPNAFKACKCPDRRRPIDYEFRPSLRGCKCSGTNGGHSFMGEKASNRTLGVFYLETNSASPYSKNYN